MSLVILHEEKLVLFAILCQPIEPRVSSKHWMKHALFLFIIWLVNLHPVAGSELTGKSRISILTLDPGKEMYTIFGHTAIRVRDETLGLDRVYNFGTFDASTPFFYLKFLQGDLNYFLSITDFDYFFRNTVDEKRSIVEQILNLTYPERQKIFNTLERQYHSNARFYKYDFFYDNCATRVRDIVLMLM